MALAKVEQSHQTVKSCSKCAHFPVPNEGVNHHGLRPLLSWQMDVTHIPSFGQQHCVHFVIDTHSGFVFASPRSGEATCHVMDHCLAAFVVMCKLLHIKTDNVPSYTSTAFKAFLFLLQNSLNHSYTLQSARPSYSRMRSPNFKSSITKTRRGRQFPSHSN
jgi:hypothetical protein